MLKPDLRLLAQWLDPALISKLEERRRLKKEWQRHRKLATLETLWLMLAVSLDTQRAGLYEILRLATGQLAIPWSISVAAFCKARARFSPGRSVLAAGYAGLAAAKSQQGRPQPFVIGQIILASRGVFFSEWIEGNGLSFRINYGLKERFVVMEWDPREGGEYWRTLRQRERAGRIPAHKSESIVTASGCLCQGDFRAGQAIPLAPASGLSAVSWADLGAWFCGGLFRWLCPGDFPAALSMSGLSFDPAA